MRTASCRYCGGILEPRATYCSDCGARVRGDGRPASAGRVLLAALLMLLAGPALAAALGCLFMGGCFAASDFGRTESLAQGARFLLAAPFAAAVGMWLILAAGALLSGRSRRPWRAKRGQRSTGVG